MNVGLSLYYSFILDCDLCIKETAWRENSLKKDRIKIRNILKLSAHFIEEIINIFLPLI